MAKSTFAVLAVAALFAAGSLAQTTPNATPGAATAPGDNGFGKCGSNSAGAGCADSTHCCSKFGFCGVGIDTFNNLEYCGEGCQGGPCKSGPIQLGAPVAGGANATTPATPATNATLPAATPAPKPTTAPTAGKPAPLSAAGSLTSSAAKVAAGVVVAGALARFA